MPWASTKEVARLLVLPEQSIIDGFKGTIDFYVWNGKNVARTWPRSPGHRRSLAVEAQWPVWTDAAKLWSQLSPEIQAAYNDMVAGTDFTGKDMFTRSYISGYDTD